MVTRRRTSSIGRHLVLILVLGVGCVSLTSGAWAAIEIANITDSSLPWELTRRYNAGLELAFDEINATRGVLGERLELITVDVKGNPDEAVWRANEMIHQHNVALISGAVSSEVTHRLSDFAESVGVLFLSVIPTAAGPIGEQGKRYTFGLRPSFDMLATAVILDDRLYFESYARKEWAIIALDSFDVREIVAKFKEVLTQHQHHVEFVEIWLDPDRTDADTHIENFFQVYRPDAIFAAIHGEQLEAFARIFERYGLSRDYSPLVVSPLCPPTYCDPMPPWLVAGSPWSDTRFLDGYNVGLAIEAAIVRAGSTDTEALVEAIERVDFESLFESPSWP